MGPAEAEAAPVPSDWKDAVAPFRGASTSRSSWQLYSTATAIVSLVAAAYWLLQWHWAYTIPVTIALSGCLVRLFILHHDCGHGSFFRTQRANDIAGTIIGWCLLTPYQAWRHQHAIHHATSGDLARRGTGDIWTLTTTEYDDAGAALRLGYRLVRNPVVMCLGGAVAVFIVGHRVPVSSLWGYTLDRQDVRDIVVTNIMTAVIWLGLYWVSPFLLVGVYLPATMLGAAVGICLFYIQHQYEDVYWHVHDAWTFERSAIEGSSHLELNAVLRWVTASIGVHHVHHLAPKIPNYKLNACAEAMTGLPDRATRLSLWSALKTFGLKLYDQEARELITFAEHKRRRAEASS